MPPLSKRGGNGGVPIAIVNILVQNKATRDAVVGKNWGDAGFAPAVLDGKEFAESN